MADPNTPTQPAQPFQPGQTNPEATGHPATAAPARTDTTATRSGVTIGAATLSTEPPGPPAQSEIGPTTYGAGGEQGMIKHGPNDPETQAAYAAGHPSQGIAQTRAAQPTPLQRGETRAATTQPQGTATQSSTQPGAQPNQPGTTQRVRMTRDEGGHANGQDVTVSADEAQRLIASGAAHAV